MWLLLWRWYHDRTIKCFTGAHAPLAIVAILVQFINVCAFITFIILKIIQVCVNIAIQLLSHMLSLETLGSFNVFSLLLLLNASGGLQLSCPEDTYLYFYNDSTRKFGMYVHTSHTIYFTVCTGSCVATINVYCDVGYAFLQPYHCLSVNLSVYYDGYYNYCY